MSASRPPSWTPSCSITTTCRRNWPRTCWTWPGTWRTTPWLLRTSSSRTTRYLQGDIIYFSLNFVSSWWRMSLLTLSTSWQYKTVIIPFCPRLWVSPCARRTWTLRSWRRSRSDWSSTPRSLWTGCCGWCSSWSPSPSSAWSSSSESSPDSDDDHRRSWTLFSPAPPCFNNMVSVDLHRL